MEIEDVNDDVVSLCRRVLSDKGRLHTAIPGFNARPQQVELAETIAQVILEKSTLIAEAGTGTGKTFAYLIPCLLSRKKALISTATKTLQDQLFQKDLPLLIRALGLSTKVQNLKGRANYICRYRVEKYTEEGQFLTKQCARDVLRVQTNLPRLTDGVRSELPEIAEDSSAWPFVTSTTDNCLGGECPHYAACFLVKARKRALEADVVVINHHLFFADSRLKAEGFGELLPGVDVVVLDEAHQVAEIATNFYGERFSTRQLRELMDDLLREWPILDLANQPLKSLSLSLDKSLDALLMALSPYEERIQWEKVASSSDMELGWKSIMDVLTDVLHCFAQVSLEENTGLARCKKRLEDLQTSLNRFLQPEKASIRWVERFKQSLTFHSTPYDIAQSFNNLLENQACAFVFTSATLTAAASFNCFTQPLGLKEMKTLQLASPFDFEHQALLYLPRGMPDPKSPDFYQALLNRALPIIKACEGRCFFLFTSHRALNQVAKRIKNHLPYPILVQGEESKPILLERFREYGNAVLLGTATFWEGVDVKGEALSCVIIDKMPFASPSDPIIQGKMHYLKTQGLSGFDELSLPNAILALKQGVGRLIRDVSDKGVLMIADPRLTGRAYGKEVFASLPAMRKTRSEENALAFIETFLVKNTPESSIRDVV